MKNCLILGGSRGIGFAIAKKMADEGNRLIIVSIDDELETCVNELKGDNHITIRYNFEDIEHINTIFEKISEYGIKLDSMMYCVGISPLVLLKDNTPDFMQKVYNINFFSFVECCKYFYDEKYSVDGGKIVAIASVAAHTSGYRQTLYGSSKAAMLAAARLMAKELLNRNIKINCISPGATLTPLLEGMFESKEEMNKKYEKNQPLGIIPIEQIADIACNLLGSGSDYITATEQICDGGILL